MDRPSKKDIKAALDRLRDSKPATGGSPEPDQSVRHLEAKKSNKNRIRKKGV